jgi:hypothetical protein
MPDEDRKPTTSATIRSAAQELLRGYGAVNDVLVDNERLENELTAAKMKFNSDLATAREDVENWRTETLITRQENENLKKEINRARAQRDHFFKAFTALKAQLTSMGNSMLEAVRSSEVHDYGERGGSGGTSLVPMPRAVRPAPAGVEDVRRASNGR